MSNHYNPSEILHSYWVYCLDQELSSTYPNQEGKWMMFFPLAEMDQRWGEACSLYRAGKLGGINSMKASTAKQNPMPQRLHAFDEGIIIFYCGPSEDEANVMEYGRNILNHMNYPRAEFHYKSDKPHLINHSRPYKNMYTIYTQEHYSGINRGFGGQTMSRFASFPNINTLGSMNSNNVPAFEGTISKNFGRRNSIHVPEYADEMNNGMMNNYGNNIFAPTMSKNFGRRNSIHIPHFTDESNGFVNQVPNVFNPPPQARARSYSVSYQSPQMDNFSLGHQSPAFFNQGFVESQTPYHQRTMSRSHTPVHFGYNPNQFQFNAVY